MRVKQYKAYLESPSAEEFIKLRYKIGWGKTDINMAEKSLKNSLFHIVVRDDSNLIGMGRVIGDGSMYFYVQDVIVDPDYQKKGIGKLLMQQIEGYLIHTALKGATIGLLSAKGKEDFYRRFGYIQRPNDLLGCGMYKFISK